MKRVYWKDITKEEKQKDFLISIIDRIAGLAELAEEISLKLEDKKGNKVEIYIPQEDFKELANRRIKDES